MSVPFYLDEHVPAAITEGLRKRGVDVLTVQEDDRSGADDDELLERAGMLRRVMFSQDTDLLRLAAAKQRGNQPFAGVIYSHQGAMSIGQAIDELEMIAVACIQEELAGQVQYLPLG